MRNENDIFREYRDEEDAARKEQLRNELAGQLFRHALSVCWLQLKEYCPDIANWCTNKALVKAGRFRGDAKFSTWFHRIVLNACTSSLRSKLRKREQSLDDIAEGILSVSNNPDTVIFFDNIRGRLSEDDQEFLRWKLEGLSDNEIVALTQLSAEGVRSKWSRIRKRIALLIKE